VLLDFGDDPSLLLVLDPFKLGIVLTMNNVFLLSSSCSTKSRRTVATIEYSTKFFRSQEHEDAVVIGLLGGRSANIGASENLPEG